MLGRNQAKIAHLAQNIFFHGKLHLKQILRKFVYILSKLENKKLHNRLCNFGPHLAQKTIFK